ncbi:MAG: hypothetical protein AB7G11_13795 [Phycisphaerales bacterium]
MSGDAEHAGQARTPEDVSGVERLLDELGERDRAAAPAWMESRVLNVVRAQRTGESVAGSGDVAAANDGLDRLGEIERGSGRPTLEDRIFAATRTIIVYQATQAYGRKRRVHPVYSSLAFRAAAGLVLGGGLIWTYMALKPAPAPTDPGGGAATVATLEAEIDRQADGLGMVLALFKPASDSTTSASSGSTSGDVDVGDWPQYEFLAGGDS